MKAFLLSWVLFLAFESIPTGWAHTSLQLDQKMDWTHWGGSPMVLINLFLLGSLYSLGLKKMRKLRSRMSGFRIRQAFSFYLGLAVVFVALVSPIDTLSDVLSWVHMIQHTLLMMVAAPLMVFGSPGYIFLWAIPKGFWKHRRIIGPVLRGLRWGRPILVWVFYALVLWIWHLPAFYQAALHTNWIHELQHLSFFGASFLFWRVTFDPYFRGKLGPEAGILYLFVASLHAMILGAFMALSPKIWYSWYERTSPQFGISPLTDQQLAGYIMWMPAGITFVIGSAVLVIRLTRESTRIRTYKS